MNPRLKLAMAVLLGATPVPGDCVKVTGQPRRKHLRGRKGRVMELYPDAVVRLDDGMDVHLTFNSLCITSRSARLMRPLHRFFAEARKLA